MEAQTEKRWDKQQREPAPTASHNLLDRNDEKGNGDVGEPIHPYAPVSGRQVYDRMAARLWQHSALQLLRHDRRGNVNRDAICRRYGIGAF